MADTALRSLLRLCALSSLVFSLAACHDSSGLSLTGKAAEPAPLMAGVAAGQFKVPVGAPLGGYLRPPVGGDYLPGLEGFAAGDPAAFFAELLDFLPVNQDHDGVPLAPVPDELRALHAPYATFSPPSRGYYDSLITKAVALYDGQDYVVFVKMDTIGMLDELVQAVADQVQADTGIDLHQSLIMSATHTHDGPGAIGNHSLRYFWIAIDAYQPALFRQLVPQIADVVKQALANLQPARIGSGTAQEGYVHPVDGPRNLNGFRRDRLESYDLAANETLRNRMGLLRVDTAAGEPLAVILNYAVHGIAFDVENLYYSGDVAGSAEREIEQTFDRPVVAMLVQNTGGDVSPRGISNDNKLQRIESYGKLIAPQVRALYDSVSEFDTAPDLRVISQRVILNRERLGYAQDEYPYPWGGVQCNNDIAVPFVDVVNSGQKAPLCIPAPPPDPQDLADNGVAENGAFVPQDTRLTAAIIGKTLVLTQPGEPLTEYGVRLLKLAQAEGFAPEKTFVWGYSQDHVGYILAPEKADWDMGGTEGTTTFWGWKQGQRFLDVNVDLMRALRDGTPAPADEFTLNYTYNTLYDLVPAAPAIPSLRAGRLVTEAANVERFQTTRFAWEGGDPVSDFPQVALEQRAANGDWQVVRRTNGTPMDTLAEMHLKYQLATGAHVWSLEFEPSLDWPLGEYRFRVAGTGGSDYALESAPFTVAASRRLVLGAPQREGDSVAVTLAYTPRPTNYRVIDPVVPADVAAPVRRGIVRFDNGKSQVTDDVPDLEVREGQLVAVYRAVIEGEVKLSAEDAFGNGVP